MLNYKPLSPGIYPRWRFIEWKGFRVVLDDFMPRGWVIRLWLGFILITVMVVKHGR